MKSKHALNISKLDPPAFVEEHPLQLPLKIKLHNLQVSKSLQTLAM